MSKEKLVFTADNLIQGPADADGTRTGIRKVKLTPPGYTKPGDFYYVPLTVAQVKEVAAAADSRDEDDVETNAEKFNFAVEVVLEHASSADGTPMFDSIEKVENLPADVLNMLLTAMMPTGKA